MICAWKEFLELLPGWMRRDVDAAGKSTLQELRLRLDKPPELICSNRAFCLKQNVVAEDLRFCINAASRYSPWAAESVSQGFITSVGGHRMGLCGEATQKDGIVRNIRHLSSLCIRIARDFPGIGEEIAKVSHSILILGSPGCGKTTLLRDLIRQISDRGAESIAVVDERGEIFPSSQGRTYFDPGKRTDVLTGCRKEQGIDMVLRTMGPATIAVDEITAEADCDALLRAGWCGVRLLATAHASSLEDLRSRPVYQKLWESRLFERVVILRRDKTWTMERVTL